MFIRVQTTALKHLSVASDTYDGFVLVFEKLHKIKCIRIVNIRLSSYTLTSVGSA